MDRKTATIVGAAAALVASPALAGSSAAEAPSTLVAASYAELLEPIPNAIERLRASDAEAAARPAQLIPAQYDRHHHHHHHHHHSRRWYRDHGYNWLNGAWVLGPRPHHHHHHNNNNY